jgi:hypothetical protein
MTNLTKENYTVELKEHVTGLGVDSRNREIGVLIEKFISIFTPTDTSYGWTKKAGTYYGFKPHSTRNSQTYGASQERRYFNTPEERDKAVAKYMNTKCKREKAPNA